jgi:two-component sensor histidine kinase
LPVRLALLVAGTTLPLILFAGAIIYRNYDQDRSDAAARVLETARNIRIVLDAEIQRITGSMQVLTLTRSLQGGDFEGFRPVADGFLKQYPGGVVVVADRDGRQLFSSVDSDTAHLPRRNNLDIVEKVFASGQPAYSDLFVGAVRKTPILTVEVPLIVHGQVVYDLSFSPPISIFQHMIELQRPDPNWTISIFDSKGVNFARVPNPEETVGKRASPTLYAQMFKSHEAGFETVSLEKVPLLTAVAQSTVTNWIVGVGIAKETLVSPLLRSLAITVAIGMIFLLTGVGFAIRMATTIARAEAQHGLMVEELNHRVKNTLAVLQAIASQTFRSASAGERKSFEGRLRALAQAHDLLSQEKWQSAGVQDVVARVLQPYLIADNARILVFGPKVPLSPPRAVMMSMILHEIATNAAKYGALSNDTGKIRIEWQVDDLETQLELTWTETGGPMVTTPTRKGFGSRLIEHGARDQLGGSATVDFLPSGAVYTIHSALT